MDWMRIFCRWLTMHNMLEVKGVLNVTFNWLVASAFFLVIESVNAFEADGIVRNGEAGFVVSNIRYALAENTDQFNACPDGMNQSYSNPREAYINLQDGQSLAKSSYEEQEKRIEKIALGNQNIKSLCLNPELAPVVKPLKVVNSDRVPVKGIDIDGVAGNGNDSVCSHKDFVGVNGEQGIDNQYFRVVGCIKGYQPNGQANAFNIAQLTGAWGVLIKLRGVDSLTNDNSVDVGIYANGDPIRLSARREPLPFASYTVHADSRFHATTQGRITDGVLHTEPTDLRIPYDINAMYVDRVLRDAKLQLSISSEGRLSGYLAGFAPVEDQYNLEIGFRNAKTSTQKSSGLGPYRLRLISGIGKAGAIGYTCEGIYQAFYDHADGHPDLTTGQCTSISTQYEITAIPAYVFTGKEGN